MKIKISFLFLLLTLATSAVEIQAGNFKNNPSAKTNTRRAQPKQVTLWREINENNLAARKKRQTTPEKYRVFRLDASALQEIFAAPLTGGKEARQKGIVLPVPMPDGKIVAFRLEETQVLAPHLAAEFPTWKTFRGSGVDDPKMTGQFDWNALGFHGYVFTENGIAMIDPYQKGATDNYLVFYKHDFGKSEEGFYCRAEQKITEIINSDSAFFAPSAPEFALGSTVRTYRLAIATTGEWARAVAGYTAGMPAQTIRTNALAVINTTVNRLNGIYLRELASQFQLVNPSVANDTTNIVFDDPATDPYNNTDQADDNPPNVDQLRVNQETLTARVGAPNFDLGHLYGTGGGVASSPSLCSDTSKAQGYSARGTNTGDPFVVDYVSHEMGHQFGANHTYNNADSSGACTTRNAATAFEPGSGSTLMSYVSICNQRNLQQYVDTVFPSFHIVSLTEINTNLTTGDPQTTGCGTVSGTNAVPTVNAGNSFTIPKLTPFTLTAGGGDADAGDVGNLLYSWEEYDAPPSPSGELGTPPQTYDEDLDGVLRPLFRAYSPVSSNQRTFPSLTFVLNPVNNEPAGSNQPPKTYTGTHPTGATGAVCETSATCVVGERLPTVNRTMNFRVSVRDRRGGVADAGTTVTVAAGAGPFQVTTQNASAPAAALAPEATWTVGSTQTVTWDVASTNVAPVSTANVNILLSTDGGQTFPITLKTNTSNDGSEQITVPNNVTNTARIKIEAVGNIFFDINNANFAIVTAPTAASVAVAGRVLSAKGRGISGAIVRLIDQNGVTRTARANAFGFYNFVGIYVGQTYSFTVMAKGYQFEPLSLTVMDETEQLNFIAH